LTPLLTTRLDASPSFLTQAVEPARRKRRQAAHSTSINGGWGDYR
jgi:hypothetical protein